MHVVAEMQKCVFAHVCIEKTMVFFQNRGALRNGAHKKSRFTARKQPFFGSNHRLGLDIQHENCQNIK